MRARHVLNREMGIGGAPKFVPPRDVTQLEVCGAKPATREEPESEPWLLQQSSMMLMNPFIFFRQPILRPVQVRVYDTTDGDNPFAVASSSLPPLSQLNRREFVAEWDDNKRFKIAARMLANVNSVVKQFADFVEFPLAITTCGRQAILNIQALGTGRTMECLL